MIPSCAGDCRFERHGDLGSSGGAERRVLKIALGLNAALFVGGSLRACSGTRSGSSRTHSTCWPMRWRTDWTSVRWAGLRCLRSGRANERYTPSGFARGF